MNCYRIRDWNRLYETHRTRRLKYMEYVYIPNKMDGSGYNELVDHPDGASHYGAWCALLQIASRAPKRGTLMRDCGRAHDCESLRRVSRIPAEVFAAAIPRLIEIGWLEEIEVCADDVGRACGDSTTPQLVASNTVATDLAKTGDDLAETGDDLAISGAPPAETARESREVERASRENAQTNGTERNGTVTISSSSARASEADVHRLLNETGLGFNCGPTQLPAIHQLIAIDGVEPAITAIRECFARGIGGMGAITYATKALAGARARRELEAMPDPKARDRPAREDWGKRREREMSEHLSKVKLA